MWHMGDGWGWWMGLGTIIMVVLVLMIIWAMGNFGQRALHDTTSLRNREEPSALEVLERRFANGDLTTDEFEEKRRVLLRRRDDQRDQPN